MQINTIKLYLGIANIKITYILLRNIYTTLILPTPKYTYILLVCTVLCKINCKQNGVF